jgi:acyl-coenzyme A thioesterase PaaI-like protein
MILVAGEGLSVDGRFCVTDHHQGAPGLAHGGLVATAMDEVLGALGWLLRTPMVTGRLQVEYLKPVPVGTELWLHAQVDGVSERRIYCQAQAHAGGADGPILARAFAVFVAVPIEHFRQHGRADLVQAATEAVNAQQAPTAWAVNP